MLETNIPLLPAEIRRGGVSACDILDIEAFNRSVLGATGTKLYVEHALSRAVDDRLETYFLSPRSTCRSLRHFLTSRGAAELIHILRIRCEIR